MAGALSNMFPVTFRPNPSHPLVLSPCRTIKATMTTNRSYFTSINADIESHLKRVIPMREPVVVFQTMHYLTFAAPQSTAPTLCVAACELIGGHRDQAVAAASALRLMYAALFTHENLQLSDPLTPRHKSTIHHAYGPNIELMIGDAMIPFGFELLATSDGLAENNPDRILRVMGEIGRAISAQGIICGQYFEQRCDESIELSDAERIGRVCESYEGTLHACAGACGAILGGGGAEEVERMRRYGQCVGKIQGLLKRGDKFDKYLTKLVEELRSSAIKELKGFNEAKIEAITSIFDN